MKYTMKWLVAIFVILFMSSCKLNSSKNSKGDDAEKNLVISVKYTSDYCGGANPTQEVLDALNVIRPLRRTELVLISGNIEIICTTDESSLITLEGLEEGKYLVYFKEKIESKSANASLDMICSQWKEKPNGKFEIVKDQDFLEITIHKTCNPCYNPNE